MNGCHSEKFLKFPDFSLPFPDNCKISLTNWINNSQISPDNGLNAPLTTIPHPYITAFSKSRAVYVNW